MSRCKACNAALGDTELYRSMRSDGVRRPEELCRKCLSIAVFNRGYHEGLDYEELGIVIHEQETEV